VALAQSAGNANSSPAQKQNPCRGGLVAPQQGLADYGREVRAGGLGDAPGDPPNSIQVPSLGSSKLTHSIVLQINASD
jgi:hypothetical protein